MLTLVDHSLTFNYAGLMQPVTSTKHIFAFTAARRIPILTDHVVRKQSL